MAKEKKNTQKGFDSRYAMAAVVFALVAVGAYYLFFLAVPPQPPPVQQPANDSGTPMAKLLLSAFESGARLETYTFNVSVTDNGETRIYGMSSNGTDGWVRETGSFGSREVLFGRDNGTDAACLTYGAETRCAYAGNDPDMAAIISDMKLFLPNKQTYLDQRAQLQTLIGVGAIRFLGGVENEQVGSFDTQKIIYGLDYRNLTVQTLISIGVPPNDPSIYSITGQQVTYWIDRASGLVVKSRATYKDNLAPKSYETEYSRVQVGQADIPKKPETSISPKTFVFFYTDAIKNYQQKLTCLSLAPQEQESCLKSMAVEGLDWEICKMITNKSGYESCTMMIAERTNNHVLCEKLEMYPDDCYIAVASQTGNFELCKKLKDPTLAVNCTQAASAGKALAEQKDAEIRKQLEGSNCKVAGDCKTSGNAKQFCVPGSSAGPFSNESSPLFACLQGVPCGCADGYCSFEKNDSYYACISKMETDLIGEYIDSLVAANNSTNNSK